MSELLVVSGLIAVVVLRNTPRLRRASPLFIGIMLVGALIALPAPLIAYLEVDSVAVCMIGVTMWHFGFILTFGSLFIKTYRVRMIFGSSVKKLRKGIKCSDRLDNTRV
ncbi:hypothetical protein SARC_08008 [Sphaeroforma arctica JP610]|uniref:G-protein coupled receptors family 3 profile domain-containing protein n=1 Tax=Sphaeroforma arctica JP610 TaxID=667725 RepID=A0A0L0FUL0_9EUKA|nr:hypothetical protein SARC_08008 [Sphaeroforma arctica JP610]KNC79598.1 hypothetical protein SARC_08008 [Sphaeroforma arctica JP610]|eukprot:XP_014153500.1 hypothetical protein SARC_08008 [Sphaeroforma arctica JP610]